MIVYKGVTYCYDTGIPVLKNINFHISRGEKVGLIGANGAGKSTLLKAALGLIETSGSIVISDLEMNKNNVPLIRKTLGYVLQDSDNQMFMPTVIEDMEFGLLSRGVSREEAAEQCLAVLNQLGLDYLATKYNHKISGGEKRMAAIATVLAMRPEAILMDEPSASLDPKNRRNLINVINGLPLTMLIATHDLDLVMETCNRVILLNDGNLIADGLAEEILSDRSLLEANSLELPLCLAARNR